MNDDQGAYKKVMWLGLGFIVGAAGGLLTGRTIGSKRPKRALPALNGQPCTALITGASSGIGAAFARGLAAEGYNLILTARREDRLISLADYLQQHFAIKVEVLAADLTDPADVARIAQRLRAHDSLTLLVNNAGIGATRYFADLPLETHLTMMQINVTAAVQLTHAVLPGMIERRVGAVINVSSIAAHFNTVGNVTYGATKSYLNAFSQALAAEVQGTGVEIQALCPGFTYTEFHDTSEFADFERSQIPKPFWMSAEAVVEASLAALGGDRVIVVPGLLNRLATSSIRGSLGRAALGIGRRLFWQ